eukprot:Amastigsp_a177069_19.p4 type:complete len:133 gc:universal Amastigsp_a177069_19:903-1301(+)
MDESSASGHWRLGALRRRHPCHDHAHSAPPAPAAVHRLVGDRKVRRALQARAAPVLRAPRATHGQKARDRDGVAVSLAHARVAHRRAPGRHPCGRAGAVESPAVLFPDLRPSRPCADDRDLDPSRLRHGALC